MKYRKKPIVVEAFRMGIDPIPKWFTEQNRFSSVRLSYISTDEIKAEIVTPEGTMEAHSGDYIIRGVKGEIYPCKPDIFEMTYEKVMPYEKMMMRRVAVND